MLEESGQRAAKGEEVRRDELFKLAERGKLVQAAQERLAQAERQNDAYELAKAVTDLESLEEDKAQLQATLAEMDRATFDADRSGDVAGAVGHLIQKALLLRRMERRSDGLAALAEALDRARSEVDPGLRLEVEVQRAIALADMGRIVEAEDILGEMLDEVKDGDCKQRMRLSALKGELYLASGRYEEAQRAYQAALTVPGMQLRPSDAIQLKAGLARAAIGQEKLETGAEILGQVLELARTTEDRKQQQEVLGELQSVDLALGQIESYLEHCQLARRVAEERNDHVEAAIQRERAAGALVHLNRHGQALTLLHESLEYVRRRGPRMKKSVLMTQLGNLYLEMDRLEDAERTFQDVLEEAREQNNPRSMAVALGRLGALYAEQGKLEAARHYGELAVEKLDGGREPEIAAEQNVLLALTYRDLGEGKLARDACWQAIELFEQAEQSEMAGRVRDLLAELDQPEERG